MRRFKSVSQRYSDALSQVSWQDFERLLANWYAGQGFRVEHVGTAGSGRWFDGGIDLKLFRGDEYVVVQCKHWNARQVTHNAVHELLGVMLTERATGAVVVTSGEFTLAARAAAAREPRAQLIDGAALRRMLGDAVSDIPHSPSRARDPRAQSPSATAWTPPAGRSRRARRRSRNPLPGMLLAIGLGLLMLYVVRHVLAEFAANRGERATAIVPASSLPPPAVVQAPVVRSPVPSAAVPANRVPPAPVVYRQASMSDAELRDWQRRNAEAMKILEKTTPEVPVR